MNSESKQKLGISSAVNYGRVDENSKYYDIRDELGKKILDYRVAKIKCQLKPNDSIYGIQIIYRNINTNKEETLTNFQSKENNKDLIEQEISFGFEEITELRTWLSEEIKLIGFEVTTNRGRSKKFGYGNDEELRKCPDFENHDKTIVGFGIVGDDKNGVTSIYAYYLKRRTYAFYMYSGIFSLRIKIKNEEYKKKVESRVPTMSEKFRILYRVCSLPDNQFFNIIKYALT